VNARLISSEYEYFFTGDTSCLFSLEYTSLFTWIHVSFHLKTRLFSRECKAHFIWIRVFFTGDTSCLFSLKYTSLFTWIHVSFHLNTRLFSLKNTSLFASMQVSFHLNTSAVSLEIPHVFFHQRYHLYQTQFYASPKSFFTRDVQVFFY